MLNAYMVARSRSWWRSALELKYPLKADPELVNGIGFRILVCRSDLSDLRVVADVESLNR
jgi:hypothetical protein